MRFWMAPAAVAVIAMPAQAATITYSDALPASPGNYSVVELPGFDPNTGVLRSATFGLDVSSIATVSYDATGLLDTHSWFHGHTDIGLDDVAPASTFNDPVANVPDQYFDIEIGDYAVHYWEFNFLPGTTGTWTDLYQYHPRYSTDDRVALLGFASAPGVKLGLESNFWGYVEQLGDGQLFTQFLITRTVSYFVSYDFGVPEPSTWTMMIVGFGAIGAALRRRRNTARSIPQKAGEP